MASLVVNEVCVRKNGSGSGAEAKGGEGPVAVEVPNLEDGSRGHRARPGASSRVNLVWREEPKPLVSAFLVEPRGVRAEVALDPMERPIEEQAF
jgi:hypothetical protein